MRVLFFERRNAKFGGFQVCTAVTCDGKGYNRVEGIRVFCSKDSFTKYTVDCSVFYSMVFKLVRRPIWSNPLGIYALPKGLSDYNSLRGASVRGG